MKARHLTAIGLVAGAALWIASGHFLPHETPESRAAIQPPAAAAAAPFRVAVLDSQLVQHHRKLLLSGRTEADKKVTLIARTAGVLTELRVRRGSRVEKGDVIAILSDEAREAQVMQAKALVEQRKIELDAKRRLIELNAVPRLELSSLEAQHKAAVAALAVAEAERDRGVITAPWSGVITELTSEVGGAALSFMPARRSARWSRSIRCWRWSKCRSAGAKASSSARWPRSGWSAARRRRGKVRYVSPSASQTTRTYRVEVEIPNRGFRDPGRHHRRGGDPARPDAGYAHSAFGADLLVRRPARRAYRQCGEHRRIPRHHDRSRTTRPSCGSAAWPTARA